MKVSGYTVLGIELPATDSCPSATHTVYVQEHSPREQREDTPRSLFLANLPVLTTETHLRQLFHGQLAGRLERVDFHGTASTESTERVITGSKRKRETSSELSKQLSTIHLHPRHERQLLPTASHAVAVFVDRPSMQLALKAIGRVKRVAWPDNTQLGAQRYINGSERRFPSRAELLRTVGEFMGVYGRLEEVMAAETARAQTVDEDGFVTVARGKRDAEREAELVARVRERERERRLGDFYRFQTRERRKAAQGELVRRFEEDRRRVDEMRRRRGT